MAKRGGGRGKPRTQDVQSSPRRKSPTRKPKKSRKVATSREQTTGVSPKWVGKAILGPFDRPLAQQAEFAAAYTRKWHSIYDWAVDVVVGDITIKNGDPRRRIAEGLLVRDVDDSEEAGQRGIPLQDFEHLPDGPTKEVGGQRRVVIKLLTWLWDVRQQDAYQPQWGTFGTGLTAREASRQFNRYIRDYINAVSKGIESRRLIVTGMSVVWWTSDPKELNYV